MKIQLLLLFLPFSLLAQQRTGTHCSNAAASEVYAFHSLWMDDFLTTKPDNGGMVLYNYDSTGMAIDGEIEISASKKFINIMYTMDKKNVMKAIIDSRTQTDTSYTFKGRWADTNEKTEIYIARNSPVSSIRVLFGPHKGDYANYWDRIYKYNVTRSN